MVVLNNLFSPAKHSHLPALDGLFQGGDDQPKSIGHLCFSSHNYCGNTTSNYSQYLHDVDHLDIDL